MEKEENQCYSIYIQQENLKSIIAFIFLICMGLICCWPNAVIVAKQELFPSKQKSPTWGVSLSAICTKAKKSILLVSWVWDIWWEAWTSARPKKKQAA